MVRPNYAVHAPLAVNRQHVSFNVLSMAAVRALDADSPCFFVPFQKAHDYHDLEMLVTCRQLLLPAFGLAPVCSALSLPA